MSGQSQAGSFEPEILMLYCENCLDRPGDLASSSRHLEACGARFVVLPCSSKIEIRDVLKLLEQGADGIQLVGCADSSCRFLVGNRRAEKRIGYVRSLLEEIGYGPERVAMVRGKSLTDTELVGMVREFAERVRPFGPSPMRK